MPPTYLISLENVDLTKLLFTIEQVREVNPQRGDMEMLSGIVWSNPDQGEIIGVKHVREDEFWIAGHIPGRPLFPGVLMIEAAAQVASFYTKMYLQWKGFIGFGGVDECKFRAAITPGQTIYLLAKLNWHRHRRVNCSVQGLVDGQLAYECKITGTQF